MGGLVGHKVKDIYPFLEKKYGQPGVEYIVYRYNQRVARQQTADQAKRIKDHAQLQQKEDLEWIDQEKRELFACFNDAKVQAQKIKKGIIAENEAKNKKFINEFSGYNAELSRLENIQKQIKQKHKTQFSKIQTKVEEFISRIPTSSSLKSLPEYDKETDAHKKIIEEQCLKKHPSKAQNFRTVELERNLSWDHFRGDFETILNRHVVGKQNLQGRLRVKSNVLPSQDPVCC